MNSLKNLLIIAVLGGGRVWSVCVAGAQQCRHRSTAGRGRRMAGRAEGRVAQRKHARCRRAVRWPLSGNPRSAAAGAGSVLAERLCRWRRHRRPRPSRQSAGRSVATATPATPYPSSLPPRSSFARRRRRARRRPWARRCRRRPLGRAVGQLRTLRRRASPGRNRPTRCVARWPPRQRPARAGRREPCRQSSCRASSPRSWTRCKRSSTKANWPKPISR